MIKNKKQLTLTKNKIKEFSKAIASFEQTDSDVHPILQKAQTNAMRFQKEQLETQVREYEQLLSEDYVVFDVKNISNLPKALIRARISMGLTQRDLAERLGLKEQQIQRYENNEYSTASFAKLVSIVSALDLKITEDVFLPKESRSKNLLLDKLQDVGLSRAFIEKRIAPRDFTHLDYTSWMDNTLSRLSKLFGWSKELLLSEEPLAIGRDSSMIARFKMPANTNVKYATAYTQYAYSIANLAVQHFQADIQTVPASAETTRELLLDKHNEIDFKSILDYSTNLGIAVIALNDSGAFHGATWRIKGRNVIVLKQKSLHTSKWAFDLLHELYHASQHPELEEFSVVESSDLQRAGELEDEEIRANDFASRVLLGENAEEYVNLCFKNAKGRIAWLKNSVIKVADKHELDCGVLAYQVANKVESMSLKSGKKANWWGAAHNLQTNPYNPKVVCNTKLKEFLGIEAFEDSDRELLEQALS